MQKTNNLKPNRLINEKNPYLLQHAHNPVDWYGWGEEAFEKAKKEDKPVFLSIGYSTCHWCHVMAHESFEDTEVAKLMNESFVNIKVDREERPDIDGIYMDVCQLLTGSGGWPLTIIMTSDKKPFFGGTYFPKNSMYGRIGMMDLIPKIMELWNNRRDDILISAEDLTERVKRFNISDFKTPIDKEILDITFNSLKSSFDDELGGFGNSPKFPIPHNLKFLINFYESSKKNEALRMVEHTLTKMAVGGIYDHIGYGFHRYSTDRQWIVPHFEKMLYDQAGLVNVYLDAYKLTDNEFYKKIAIEVLTYVERDLLSPEGGFYSAEDADSEGYEGKFYLWNSVELKEILSSDYELFAEYFNVLDEGNFNSAGGHFESGQNILHSSNSEYVAGKYKLTEQELNSKIESLKSKLFNIRELRIHPHKDIKILTDWNAMMISAFVKAYNTLGETKYIEIAKNAIKFIENNLFDESGRLLHRYNSGSSGIFANADDYAFLIRAYLDIYKTEFESHYLLKAVELNKHFIEHFWDNEGLGFYFTPGYGEKLILRKKEYYDGAIPSGNSVAMGNLTDIWKFTADNNIKLISDNLIKAFSTVMNNMPMGYSEFMCSYMKSIKNSYEVVIVAKEKKDAVEYINYLKKNQADNAYIILITDNNSNELKTNIEYLKNYILKDNKPTIYLCHDFQCENPINDFSEFEEMMKDLNLE